MKTQQMVCRGLLTLLSGGTLAYAAQAVVSMDPVETYDRFPLR